MPAFRFMAILAGSLLAFPPGTRAQAPDHDSVELAKKLANPVADLISVPFQFNYNGGFFEGDGDQYYLNIQPVTCPTSRLPSRTGWAAASDPG